MLPAEELLSNINYTQAIIIADRALSQADTVTKKAKIYELKIKSLVNLNNLDEAKTFALEILAYLNIALENERPAEFTINQLNNLPTIQSTLLLTIQHILKLLGEATYMTDPDLCTRAIWTEFAFALQNGKSALSAVAYSDYGFWLCSIGEIDRGYTLGKLAIQMLKEFNCGSFIPSILELFNGHTRHWKESIKNSLDDLETGFQLGISEGNFSSGLCAIVRCDHLIFTGRQLQLIEQEYRRYNSAFKEVNLVYPILYSLAGTHLILQLQGKESSLNFAELQDNKTALFAGHLARLIINYFLGSLDTAILHGDRAKELLPAVPGQIVAAPHNFFYSLALLAHRTPNLSQIDENQQQLKRWAQNAPINFQDKYDLIEAEQLRVMGKYKEAESLYLQTIQATAKEGNIYEIALTNKLTGDFYRQRGQSEIAKKYLIEAHLSFILWGARAIATHMEQEYECLKPRNLNTDLAQTICSIVETGCSKEIRHLMKRARATLTYNLVTQEVEVTVKDKFAATMIEPCLSVLKEKSPTDKVTLKVSN